MVVWLDYRLQLNPVVTLVLQPLIRPSAFVNLAPRGVHVLPVPPVPSEASRSVVARSQVSERLKAPRLSPRLQHVGLSGVEE